MKILLVEDDPFFQKFYAFKLRERQYEVEVAINGEDGMAKLQSFTPDVILLDLIMPKMDGFSMLQEIKGDESRKGIPIIIFSTLGQEKDIERAKKLGAADFVNKSVVDFDTLVKKVQIVNQT